MPGKVTKIGRTGTVTVDTSLLENLVKGIDLKLAVRVGILGATGRNRIQQQKGESNPAFAKRIREFQKSNKAKGDLETNADIGLAHEKGIKSKNLPRRSWLEEPLRDHLSEYFSKAGKKAIEQMLLGTPRMAYAQLGLIAEVIIQKGFASGGYGKWKPLSPITIARKGSSAILIDTAQLRRSVTSEVIAK